MKTTDFITENQFIGDDAHAMHQDHEVQMARSDCYSAAKYAIELHKMLKNVSEMQGLDGWVSEKLTLANDYLRTVHEYLTHDMSHPEEAMPEMFTAESAEIQFAELLGETAGKQVDMTGKKKETGVAEAAKWRDSKYQGKTFDYDDSYEGPGDTRAGKVSLDRAGMRQIRTFDPLEYKAREKQATGKLTPQDVKYATDKNFKKEKQQQLDYDRSRRVAEATGYTGTGMHPKVVEVLKQRGFKGPYQLGKLKKWQASLNDIGAGPTDEIMVTGNDVDYDEWVVAITPNHYVYGAETGYNTGSAARVIKDTTPVTEEGVAEAGTGDINRLEHRGAEYNVYFNQRKGMYTARGTGQMSGQIAPQWFRTLDDAQEHAETEIGGYDDKGVTEATGDTSFDSMMGNIVKGARYKGAAADQRADAAYGGMMNNITKNAADVAKPSADSKFEQVYSAVERILLSNNVHWDIDDDISDALKKLKIKASDALMQKLERELINRVSDALQYYDDGDLAESGVTEAGRPDVMRHRGDTTIRVVKRAGKPIGEIGIDSEASEGNGSYYVKLYDGSYDAVGFDTAAEALAELKAAISEGITEANRGFRGVGGAREREDDERHDLDPSDWYIVKDGKLLKASIYPNQHAQARAEGFSPTREQARARASNKGVAEGSDKTAYPNATVIKSKNGRPIGEVYQDEPYGWGCFHYGADNGADSMSSREQALAQLKDMHDEYRQQGVTETTSSAGMATAPGVGKGPKTGTLFGGSYAPRTPFAGKKKANTSVIKR